MEKFPITDPPKFGCPVFRVLTEMEYQHWPLWKNWKMAAISLILILRKNFQLPTPPQSLGLWFSECQQKWNIIRKPEIQIFFFSEFSIGSFFPITHPRFHLNTYAWLHLKHLCMDIYASLVYPTSHLCVVLHFLIFYWLIDLCIWIP